MWHAQLVPEALCAWLRPGVRKLQSVWLEWERAVALLYLENWLCCSAQQVRRASGGQQRVAGEATG